MASDIYQEGILRQKAVYWEAKGKDQNGQPIYENPIQIRCRWEDTSKLFLNDRGEEEVSRSLVYVDRDMRPNSVLWLGSLGEIDSIIDPFLNQRAWSIRYFQKIPNRRGKKFVRIATL